MSTPRDKSLEEYFVKRIISLQDRKVKLKGSEDKMIPHYLLLC
jgi:hypothetical protein